MDSLSLVRRGELIDDLNNAIAEVVQAVIITGEKGRISLTLSIGTEETKAGTIVTVNDKIATKLPELSSPETRLWADEHGELFEDDPRQGKLFDQPKATIKPAAIEHQAEDVADVIEPDQTTKFRKVY